MAMKSEGRSPLAPKKSIRPKDATEARAKKNLERAMGGATERTGKDYESRMMPGKSKSKSGAVAKSPRPPKNPRY